MQNKSGNCVWKSMALPLNSLGFTPVTHDSVNFIENIRSKIQRLKIRDDSWTQQEFDGGLVKRKRGIHTKIGT